MRIVCIGGGPAGLYFSILMKKAAPAHDVTVIERDRRYVENMESWLARKAQRDSRPVPPMFTPFRLRSLELANRNEVGMATMAVGNIFEPDHVNSIIAAGRADLCALARPHLADPCWTLRAATQLQYPEASWPAPYLAGKAQAERQRSRERAPVAAAADAGSQARVAVNPEVACAPSA